MKQLGPKIGKNIANITPKLDWTRKILAQKTRIKKWYLNTYPTDKKNIKDMDENATFLDLFEALNNYRNVYYVIFKRNADSLVRERCFAKLAEITKSKYNDIYEQWLQYTN